MEKKIRYIKNENEEIVGFEINERLDLKELEMAYPRHLYPKQWESIDKGEPTTISTPIKR